MCIRDRRDAFQVWKDVGIGLEFEEVNAREDAAIRIGFMKGDGHWSFLGRQILSFGPNQRTMNFGEDLSVIGIDTAIHEIGHTLGLPHEHQNPNAGIVWDEQAVIDDLAGPPNRWDEAKTRHNILRKIHPDTVQGSNWDPDSIMHYPFGPGLIIQPHEFNSGISPAPGLSDRDKTWIRTFYPPLSAADFIDLAPMESVPMTLSAGEQMNFRIRPAETRNYNIQTFGECDGVAVLYEKVGDENRYMTADDSSGEERAASMRVKLYRNHEYLLKFRLYYAKSDGNTAMMLW